MISIWHWHTEPALIGGILFVVWAYLILLGPLRHKIAPQEPFPKREFYWFIAAAASFYLAVGSPLDALGENFLFSAHMVQHMLLMYAAALFTVLAVPGWLFDGLTERYRILDRIFGFLFRPLAAGFFFTFVFCGWHFPTLYEAALHDKVIHMLEHLTMYGVSVMMLWVLLSKSKRMPPAQYGIQLLYLFLLMVAQIPLFAILTFSTEVLYPTYDLAPRVIELTPLGDQVLGGLIMKVSNMLLSLFFMGRAFYLWGMEAQLNKSDAAATELPQASV
jgi:putative membrane protein